MRNRERLIVGALLALGCPAALSPSAQERPAATDIGAPAASLPPKQKNGDVLIAARSAAARSDHAEAHRLYDQVLKIEQRNENALRGKAALHLADREWAEAIKPMEKILALRPTDRSVTLNLSAAYLKLEPPNAMRSAKLVMDYLQRAGGSPDEQMANALGTAISNADDQARQATFFPTVRDFYFAYDRRLETARRDGKRRWGAQWINAGLAEEKWANIRNKTAAVEVAYRSWTERTVETRKSREALAGLQISLELVTQQRLRAARQRVAAAERAEHQASQRLSRARGELARVEQPPMMPSVETVTMEWR